MTTVASFEIPYFSYLKQVTAQGSAIEHTSLTEAELIKLYSVMQLTRLFDEKAIALQRTGKMGTYASSRGQEAIGAAIGHAMQSDDVFVPYYRDYAAQLQRGVSMLDLYNYWGGSEWGNHYADNAEDLPICVPIASQCLHAAGVATAFKLRKQKRVAVTTLGEGGTSEGDFYEALNVAGVWHLPLVFIVNNNQWAISVPLSKQTASQTIAQKAVSAGFAGEQVDGNDVIALRERIAVALEKARSGKGPTLIEALTYRLCDHTTADDASRYRSAEEYQEAEKHEPILQLRHYLQSHHNWQDNDEQRLIKHCKLQIEQTVEAYLSKKTAPVTDMFDYHFESLTKPLEEQRQQALEEVNHG